MSFLPGMSAAVSTATTPGAARTASRSSRRKLARRLVGHADGDMQRARGLADVVDIGRGAAHVQARGIVRVRLVDDRVSRSSGTRGISVRLFSSTEVSEAGRGAGARDFHQRAQQQIGRRLRCDRRRSRACR